MNSNRNNYNNTTELPKTAFRPQPQIQSYPQQEGHLDDGSHSQDPWGLQPRGSFQQGRVYLDHNATTPLDESLKPQIVEWLEEWGNPSSVHWSGRGSKVLMRDARQRVADFLLCHPLEIIFTSGGSEANNLAIKGVFDKMRATSRNHYICSAVEHPSVLKTMEYLASCGARVDVIPVHRSGELDMEFYQSRLSCETALVSIMFANNETGSIFPVKKCAKMAHEVGALYHCDGVQALGKVLIHPSHLDVDLCSFSAHKFYSLKGCGVLYVKKGIPLTSLIHGGPQERRRRAGTENLLAVASFGALLAQGHDIVDKAQGMKGLRNFLQEELLQKLPGVHVVGREAKRLPNTLNLVIDGVDGEILLMNLDMAGFAVSTGAACSSGSMEPSLVLQAMGLSRREAQSSLRLSLGWNTSREDLKEFVQTLVGVVARLRSLSWQD